MSDIADIEKLPTDTDQSKEVAASNLKVEMLMRRLEIEEEKNSSTSSYTGTSPPTSLTNQDEIVYRRNTNTSLLSRTLGELGEGSNKAAKSVLKLTVAGLRESLRSHTEKQAQIEYNSSDDVANLEMFQKSMD